MVVLKKKLLFAAFLLAFFAVPITAQSGQLYWDEPVPVSSTGAYFPAVVSDGNTTWCFFEEAEVLPEGSALWISVLSCSGTEWGEKKRVAGPFSYSGDIPDCFSAACTNGILSVAVAAAGNAVHVYTSDDGGAHFSESSIPVAEQTAVGPRLFAAKDGSLVLFATLGSRELVGSSAQEQYERFSFSLIYTTSADGLTWKPFSFFKPSAAFSNPFSPFLCPTDTGDMVLFQAQYESDLMPRFSNQLYSTCSSDGGQTWSDAALVTGADSVPLSSERNFFQYHNQRPFVYASDGHVYAAWERSVTASEISSVWITELDLQGHVLGTAEQVSSFGSAHRPVLFAHEKTLYGLWFDNRSGTDRVSLVRKNGYLWSEVSLPGGKTDAAQRFASPVLSGGELSFVWQQSGAEKPRLYALQKDRRVDAPSIRALSFKEGRRGTAEKVRARVELPRDVSGIAGFSWIWTQDAGEEPPKLVSNLADETELTAFAPEDGVWFFKVRVRDYAGNWSPVSSLTYRRDITPPRAPVIVPPAHDEFGFVASNDFRVDWTADAADDDVEGFSWSLEYVSAIPKSLSDTPRHPLKKSPASVKKAVAAVLSPLSHTIRRLGLPPRRLLSAKSGSRYKNKSNGVYVFSVCAVDSVGNIGPSASCVLLLNKYEPSTAIVSVRSETDVFGGLDVSVSGKGFTYDGTISEVYIDRDGTSPYDITLTASSGEFSVVSDELIRGIHLENADAGIYRVGLLHTDRGLYFSDKTLKIDEYGTVKLESPYLFSPDWLPVAPSKASLIQPGLLLVWTIMLFAMLGLIFVVRGFSLAAREAVLVRREVTALLQGEMMPLEKKKRASDVKRRRMSLKVKFSIFTVQGVLVVAALVSAPLGYLMLRTQSSTLASGLEQRVHVLMNGIATSVRMYMPAQNDLELGALPSLKSSMAESESITILGLPRTMDNTNINYVWATNDEDILSKIDSPAYVQGASALTDPGVLEVLHRFTALDEEAAAAVGEMSHQIHELTVEGASLALRGDAEAETRRNQINDEVRLLTNRSTELLEELSDKAFASVPAFDTTHLDTVNRHYMFYKPVLYRQGDEATYVRAVIIMQVSTEALLKTVARATRGILTVSLSITLIVTLIGIFSSLVFVSVLVRPIRQLVKHVEMISHTRRKETLAGQEITVKSRDEIGLLGETVNEMTRSLVKAALDENLLMDGKSVQQAFIPLQTDPSGNKRTTALLNDAAVKLFGYYEGASGVSGDYFDYKKLDDRWYCLIKCDASGHGVPAALIMTVVATMFRQYFESWSWRINGVELNKLVTNINDFIESLGLKGKFATLMLCLFDTKDGDVYMCNAGDNIIHYYDRSEQRERTVSLAETPAAGPLPSFMIDMKGGFTVEKLHLDSGDVLFLYTDGIEESTRKFRDSDFAVVKCGAGKPGDVHENHRVGEDSEQLSPERIQALIEAVFSHGTYRLEKYHNPIYAEELVFDFTGCEGTVQDAVLALASVEKVFRMYKSPECTESDMVRVDRNIDSFLKEHFNRYSFYCGTQNDVGEPNYLYYTNLKEDEQLDDLTLLAVQKS
ncbi:MAG: SpoIIE family protein phosphatase [Treponema sp.]|nr:SpoIIE family protein phosphatase [Treponema sp.]